MCKPARPSDSRKPARARRQTSTRRWTLPNSRREGYRELVQVGDGFDAFVGPPIVELAQGVVLQPAVILEGAGEEDRWSGGSVGDCFTKTRRAAAPLPLDVRRTVTTKQARLTQTRLLLTRRLGGSFMSVTRFPLCFNSYIEYHLHLGWGGLSSATASVGDGLARRDRGFAQGTTRNVSRQAVSISIGVAVGLALVLLCLTGAFLSHAVGPTAGPPPFAFQIVVNGSATVPGGFQYNLTLAWIEHGLPALGWIQFYVLTGNLTVVVPFTVNVTTLAGCSRRSFRLGKLNLAWSFD